MPYISYEDFLAHEGIKQRFPFDPKGSGRWRLGSGENPFQHDAFMNLGQQIRYLTQQGLSDKAIAEKLGIYANEHAKDTGKEPSSKKVREIRAATKELEYQRQIITARRLYSEMMAKNGKVNVSEIARQMETNESNVRNYLKDYEDERKLQIIGTADFLRDKMQDTRFLMLGEGAELDLGVTPEKLDAAITLLEQEGYHKEVIKEDQFTTNNQTTIEVLCRPEDTWTDLVKNKDQIDYIVEYSPDGGKTIWTPEYPAVISSDRVAINYAEDGGKAKDGIIEIRRGVKDLSLGDSNYAQVRINVDDKLYLKGMALYSNNVPEGYDILFNTNKTKDKPFDKVLKPLKDDKDNPFGATIKEQGQYHYTDENGEDKLGVINKLNEEGDWGTWSKTLSSQFLSKQPERLIEKQLKATILEKEDELSDIKTITNPVVRSKFLIDYGDACDKSASELKATGFPGQASYVLLPIPSLKENEIYAPKFKNGQKVALVRYPHAGTFEIPVLTVNNNNKEGNEILGNPRDGVGINPAAAVQMSGADFDGDTALVIPIKGGAGSYKTAIKHSSPLEQLKNFEPDIYKLPDSAPGVKEQTKQKEMGIISNLITDMSFQNPTEDELARAVKHSMVVIDSPKKKHHLDYKQSFKDNRIEELQKKYQIDPSKKKGYGGAGSLISRAGSEDRVNERETLSRIDPETGKRVYKETGRTTYTDYKDNNKEKWAFTKVNRMSEVDDAMELVSANKHPVELLYADFANHMKSYANSTRKEAITLKKDQYSREAADKYSEEVKSINAKLDTYTQNKPRERMALIYGNQVLKAKKRADPTIADDKDHYKKLKNQIARASRAKYGSNRKGVQVHLTDKEWEACNAGALSNSKLETVINAMDKDELRSFAIPKQDKTISKAKIALIKAKIAAGYKIADIAESVNVSTSTVEKYM